MPSSAYFKAFILAFIAISAFAHTHDASCGHKYFNEPVGHIDVEELPLPGKGNRNLQSTNATRLIVIP